MGSGEPRRLVGRRKGAEQPGASATTARTTGFPVGPIVSSAHLAAGAAPGLSEVEFGLILASHAFERWMVRCMAAAGVGDLSPVEVLIMHTVRHRDRPKKLADVCLVLGIEDTHVVNYAIKKLTTAKLVASHRVGKEKVVAVTREGAEACARYHEIRERLLIRAVKSTGLPDPMLSELGALLRALSGHYDQAARSATTL
ncbi:MAG TPA: winged helix DNA-binding protein [Hyphomicrobiaceae bacterium]|nr:winged helix DNA-binding protein [Hyphomicrobiaceae bacterium]